MSFAVRIFSALFFICSTSIASLPVQAAETEKSDFGAVDFYDFCADPSFSYEQRIDFFTDQGWSIVEFQPLQNLETDEWDLKNPQHAAFVAISVLRYFRIREDSSEISERIQGLIESGSESWFGPLHSDPFGVTLFKDGTLVSFAHSPPAISELPPEFIQCYYFGKLKNQENTISSIEGFSEVNNPFYRAFRFGSGFSDPPTDNYYLIVPTKRLEQVFEVESSGALLGRFFVNLDE